MRHGMTTPSPQYLVNELGSFPTDEPRAVVQRAQVGVRAALAKAHLQLERGRVGARQREQRCEVRVLLVILRLALRALEVLHDRVRVDPRLGINAAEAVEQLVEVVRDALRVRVGLDRAHEELLRAAKVSVREHPAERVVVPRRSVAVPHGRDAEEAGVRERVRVVARPVLARVGLAAALGVVADRVPVVVA